MTLTLSFVPPEDNFCWSLQDYFRFNLECGVKNEFFELFYKHSKILIKSQFSPSSSQSPHSFLLLTEVRYLFLAKIVQISYFFGPNFSCLGHSTVSDLEMAGMGIITFNTFSKLLGPRIILELEE